MALNARLLSVDPTAFDQFLIDFPNAQVQAWTGTNEPPIPVDLIENIRKHYDSTGTSNRTGFDCVIENSDGIGINDNSDASRRSSFAANDSRNNSSSRMSLSADLGNNIGDRTNCDQIG